MTGGGVLVAYSVVRPAGPVAGTVVVVVGVTVVQVGETITVEVAVLAGNVVVTVVVRG